MANLVSGSFKSTNVNDGADARLLMLETSGNVIGFDAEGKAVPGQKLDIVAYIQNIEGSPVFTAIPYIGETAQTPITLKGSGNARYITGEEWNKDWNRLIVSVSLAGFTDSTTIAKVQDGSGKDGQNAIVGLLTNEAITLSADENGNIPDFSTATGEFQIYDGLTKVTEGVSFAISGQVGASGTINQNGVYNVTAMTADTATIEFKATYKGTEIVKKLSLAKSRKGQPGKNANLLYLSVSNNVIVFDANDVAFPNQRISIVAKLQNISGTATFKAIPYINATAQPGIALSGSGNDRYISGENWDKRWTSLSVTATIGELSDQTTIYKISEVKGADGKNTIVGILTNESITISADANGNVPDFTKATGTFQIYDGIALVDPKNVTYAVHTQTGATATIGTNGVYKITAMTADTATVVFKATYGGVERTKQLSIAKSKAGQKGEAGNGIKSTKTQYQRSADGQTPPTGTWLDEIPVVPPGEFLWTRVTQTFDDDTTSVSYSVSKMGEDGVGLESTEIFYVGSTNGQTPPESGWQMTVPNVPQGQYMWTKIVWTYSDDSIKTAYSVGKIGANGANGNDGLPGKDGVGIADTLIEYAVNTSGTVRPTSGWSTTIPSVPQGQYLWTRTTWTYTDNTTEQGFTVARQGEKGDKGDKGDQGIAGPKGADGKTQYTHIAYADNASGGGFSQSPTGKAYIGMYVDFEELDSSDPTKYAWSLIKGADGEKGVAGPKGEDGRTPYFHTAYTNSTDFGAYDYSGNPNLMHVIKASDFKIDSDDVVSDVGYNSIRVTSQGVNRLGLFTLNKIPSLVNGKTYTISAKIKFEEGSTGDINKLRVSYRQANSGAILINARSDGAEVGKEIIIKGTATVNYVITDVTKFYLTIDTDAGAKINGSVIVSDIKIEEGSTATPYQPNLLDAPWYFSTVPLGENIADPAVSFPIKTSAYRLYGVNMLEEFKIGQRYTLTMKATKPASQTFFAYNGGNISLEIMTPVEGLTDVWSCSFTILKIDSGSPRLLSIYQSPQSTVGACQIDWLKIEKGNARTPNIDDYKYLGNYTDFVQADSSNPTKYSWSQIKGDTGETQYTHIAYANSADGADGFTTVYPNLNLLDGTKDFSGTWKNSSDWVTNGTYKGLTVKKRTWQWNGIYKTFTAPKDGIYTFSAYIKSSGNSANVYRYGAVNATSSQAPIQQAIGNNFDWTRDSVTLNLKANDVAWVRYEITGTGADSILWTAGHKYELSSTSTPYMPSDSEVITADWPSYIGQYTDLTQANSTNPSDYTWSLIRGNDGADGKDGVSVKTITTTYQAGTSGTTPPTGAWLPTPPTVAENQFLWTKIEIALDNGTKSTGYSVGKMGAQGQPGEKGDPGAPGTPGNGIKSSSVTYQVSTSGTTTPTGTWVSTPPAVPQGQYLWTRTVLTFDNGQSVTAYAVSKAGIDGENGLNNDNMVFNNRFEKFNEWPQNSMGWYKTQFTQATQPETDKPTNNILKIGGDASSGLRYTFSRSIAVVPGTTIELSFDAKLSRLFTNKNIAIIRMFDAEHANSSDLPDTVGGNSYIDLYMDGTAIAGAGVTEYDGKNTPIKTANTWYRYKVRFLVPDNVTNVKIFFITADPNASSFLFVRDPQGVIYKDLNANTRNFALDSRFPSAKTIGATTTRRKNIQLSRPTKAGEKYTIAFDYSLISGTLTSQIQVVLADKNEAGKGNVLLNTSGNKNRLVGEITATGEADHLQIFHGVGGGTTEATNYEFEKIMFNLGDKTFDYEQAPEDGFSTTNVWPNSSWNIGKGAWVFTDDQFEILAPETDKPESSILHGKPKNINFQQTYQIPHPRFVNAGDIVHVSFDYKEKNRTADTMLACVRIFPEKDTVNSSSNALMEKYITPSVLGWSLANNTNWIKVDYVFRSTVSGWLDILPYDNDATGNHESFYREIFVTNAGKLHGEWSPAQVDFATQINGIPKVFVQANMPTDPSIKNGDQWWVQSGNRVTSIKVYGNGAWHDQAIDQAVLNIVQLNAVNINGSVVNGSQFINTFDIKDSDHSKMKGTTKIQDGFIMQDVENIGLDASGAETKKFLESHMRLSYGSFLSQSTLFDDQGKQTSNSSSNLTGGYLNLTLKDSSGTYNGTLDAKALTNTGWKTLRLNSQMDIAEGNPPQYRIFYQLDGSKLIKFRGQVKMKSGKMLRTKTYYPFQNGDPTTASSTENYVPTEIRPDRTAFGYGAGPNAGGRIAATTTPRILINPAEDGDYFSLEAFQYIKD